jgi:hypothetical protein
MRGLAAASSVRWSNAAARDKRLDFKTPEECYVQAG